MQIWKSEVPIQRLIDWLGRGSMWELLTVLSCIAAACALFTAGVWLLMASQ